MNQLFRERAEAAVICGGSLLLVIVSWLRWLPLDVTEALGFATGAICVWLVTKGNIWNWPIGLEHFK